MAIRVLDINTISKIAAGEVIENPASVVKELVENSIDAKAKHIVIEIKEGGTKSIKVSDDGTGIEKEDIELAFMQHATSKLSDISDLDTIESFGFRGEALSSIASVSSVRLITKRKVDNKTFGYRCILDFGGQPVIDEVASNDGTSIEVIDLFKNVPVRKKFLKGISRENALIEDLVIKFALVRDDISFELIVDNKRKFYSNGDSNLKNVVFNLYGKEVLENLLEVNYNQGDMSVEGLIAKPIIARNTRNDEIYFVNERYVKDKTISRAIEGAYEGFLMQHKFPLVILKIRIDSSKVDVNVHPKKTEVRFSNEELVYFSVYNAIHSTLDKVNLIHEEKLDVATDNSVDIENYDHSKSRNIESETNSDNLLTNLEKKQDIQQDLIDVESLPSMSSVLNSKVSEGISISNLHKTLSSKYEEKPFIQKTLSEDHKYIGQVFNTYILVEFENKLYIIDQHAAHEKINYERIMSMYRAGKVSSQKIFPSIILKLTPIQYDSVIKNIDEFRKLGYELEGFGNNDIKVDSVPYNIFNIGNDNLLMDMIDSFADDKNKEQYESIVDKIASISCKKAIKANHILSEIEVKQLLRDLFSLENPYNCPHGRPTIISLSKQEFEKKFGRIV